MQETPIRPIRQNDLVSAGFAFLAGGRYVNPVTKQDFTGSTFTGGTISVVDNFRPRFVVNGNAHFAPLTAQGPRVKVNMIKSSIGWKWKNGSDREETTLVTVERGGKHFYTVCAKFANGVTLTTYPNSKSEPRLRPMSFGPLGFGQQIGTITMRGLAVHSVYDTITIGGQVEIST